MTARGSDRIFWLPIPALGNHEHVPGLKHICPTAVLVAPTTREALDPMALGTCRYCKETLP